jgi:hypothetical protein
MEQPPPVLVEIGRRLAINVREKMGLAQYAVVAAGNGWTILHDGNVANSYATKEAAFEAAVVAASLAIREGHEVHVSVPGREAGDDNTTPDRANP